MGQRLKLNTSSSRKKVRPTFHDTPFCTILTTAEAVEHLEGALWRSKRRRADRHRVVVVEQQHLPALAGEVDRGGQTHRACADDHQG